MGGDSGRQPVEQVVGHLRGDLAFGAAGANSAVYMGDLPQSAVPLSTVTDVQTAYNAGTTNVAEVVGFLIATTQLSTFNPLTTAADITLMATGTFAATATGTKRTEATPNGRRNSDTSAYKVYARYQPTGTAATTGASTSIVEFVAQNQRGNS